MLDLTAVEKTYAGPKGAQIRVLSKTALTLKPKEFVAVRGPSGCGKSTLLLVCGGLLTPERGQVLFGDLDVYAQSAQQRARWRAQHIGFVFQQFHLIPYLSVRHNILAATLTHTQEAAETRLEELLTLFGLQDRVEHLPAALSVGERQRVGLARALFNKPDLILADEPTGNLDPETGDQITELLLEMNRKRGTTLVVVTHSASLAATLGRTLVLEHGKLREGGGAAASPRAD
jgi:ABC-type lipoprotein export system ATPase subunit